MAYTYNVEKQHEKGKWHAIERINNLVDKDSFMEIYSGVRHNCTSFGMEKKDIPYDGVITGFGTINGRKVAVYAQDFTVQGGSLGLMHGKKIAELIDKAIQARCPVIGINDSGGARIQEGVDALCGYGDLFYQNVRASGSVPQISIIAGPCAGGAVYSPGITDFIFAVDKISQLFITGPKVVKSVMFMDISAEDLGGASIHSKKSGVAQFRCISEPECFEKVRKLLDYIPHYYGDEIVQAAKFKYDEHKKTRHIGKILPENTHKGYDIREVIEDVTDDGSFFETSEEFAINCVTGFAKVEGRSVGIVANNPAGMGGVLDCDASDKIARHVRYCDAYNIPLLTFVDVPGFIPGPQEEQKGIIRHGAKVIYAYSESSVPKVTVITRKAYGGAYIAMCSKHIGADYVYAWPTSEIAVMGADGAIGILYAKDLKDPEKAEYVAEVIEDVTDDGSFFETSEEFAINCVTGFAKVEGRSVGIVANNPAGMGGVLDCDASDKIARHVRYCDAYNIPLLTFVDVPGFIPGPQEEQKGIIRHGAKVIYAYSESSVPKVTVITRKAYGGAYIAMCSKHIGADYVYAWPTSEIAVMGADGAIGILYAKDLKDPEKAEYVAEKKAQYEQEIMTPKIAAKRGYISEVIEPSETRKYVANSFRFLADKQSMDKPAKKHGNIPL